MGGARPLLAGFCGVRVERGSAAPRAGPSSSLERLESVPGTDAGSRIPRRLGVVRPILGGFRGVRVG